MTRKALAEKIGISASSLKNYETGRVNPNVYTVNDIANAMGMQGWKLVKEMLKELAKIRKALEKIANK